jgi:hypothetical protein
MNCLLFLLLPVILLQVFFFHSEALESVDALESTILYLYPDVDFRLGSHDLINENDRFFHIEKTRRNETAVFPAILQAEYKKNVSGWNLLSIKSLKLPETGNLNESLRYYMLLNFLLYQYYSVTLLRCLYFKFS